VPQVYRSKLHRIPRRRSTPCPDPDPTSRSHGDDEREDLDAGERQYTSADLTAHDSEHGQLEEAGEGEAP